MNLEERKLWFQLKKEYLEFKIDGTMYKAVEDAAGNYDLEAFDYGKRGEYLNTFGLKTSWTYEGKYLISKLRNSRKRKMKRMVETRLRKLARKYKTCEEK